jgi:hypothetical protein
MEDMIMSHWRKFSSDVLTNTKVSLLSASLAEMGVELDTSIKNIRNTWGQEEVDMGFKVDGRPIALGLKETVVDGEKKMELRGDFYGTGLNESQFMDKLSQVYQKNNIVEKLEDNRWTVENVKTDEYGNVVIEAYEYAMA